MDILIFSLLSSILPLLISVIEPIMRFSVILVAFSVTVSFAVATNVEDNCKSTEFW